MLCGVWEDVSTFFLEKKKVAKKNRNDGRLHGLAY